MVWLPDTRWLKKNLKILLVLAEFTNVTDGQMDTARRQRPRTCIALRDNKRSNNNAGQCLSNCHRFFDKCRTSDQTTDLVYHLHPPSPFIIQFANPQMLDGQVSQDTTVKVRVYSTTDSAKKNSGIQT